jgi:hypothetical protein
VSVALDDGVRQAGREIGKPRSRQAMRLTAVLRRIGPALTSARFGPISSNRSLTQRQLLQRCQRSAGTAAFRLSVCLQQRCRIRVRHRQAQHGCQAAKRLGRGGAPRCRPRPHASPPTWHATKHATSRRGSLTDAPFRLRNGGRGMRLCRRQAGRQTLVMQMLDRQTRSKYNLAASGRHYCVRSGAAGQVYQAGEKGAKAPMSRWQQNAEL